MILNPLQEILQDHHKFLLITADVISHSITDSQWTRIKSLLSPENKFVIPDSLNFAVLIVPKTIIIPKKLIWFKKRNVLVFHVTYEFSEWEGSACTEFFMRGPRNLLPLTVDCDGVTHQISVPNLKDTEIQNIYGVVTVEKTKTADTYNRLLDMPVIQQLLSDRNYYANINKSVLKEIL